MATKQDSLTGGEINWKDLQEYARAYRRGQIPESILAQSEITYEKPGLFRTWRIPLPKDLRFREALAEAEIQQHGSERNKRKASRMKA